MATVTEHPANRCVDKEESEMTKTTTVQTVDLWAAIDALDASQRLTLQIGTSDLSRLLRRLRRLSLLPKASSKRIDKKAPYLF